MDEVTGASRSTDLAETLREALGAGAGVDRAAWDAGAEPRLDTALSVMSVLLELGWSPPETVLDDLAAGLGEDAGSGPESTRAVRSLAEDLAVVRMRSRSSRERATEVRQRARRVLDRASTVHARAVQQARQAREAAVGRGPTEQDKIAQLEHALATRPGIEHAVGMVMLVRRCDRDEAWDALTRLSMASNRKVLDIAAAMVTQVGAGGLTPQLTATLKNI